MVDITYQKNAVDNLVKGFKELVRFQKENNRQKNKDEQKVWLRDILASERQHNPNGKYYDKIQCSIPAQARKILAIRENIGLN